MNDKLINTTLVFRTTDEKFRLHGSNRPSHDNIKILGNFIYSIFKNDFEISKSSIFDHIIYSSEIDNCSHNTLSSNIWSATFIRYNEDVHIDHVFTYGIFKWETPSWTTIVKLIDFRGLELHTDNYITFYNNYQCIINDIDIIMLSESNINKDELCTICLNKLSTNTILHKYPCNHLFHKICSIKWLINKINNKSCPVCRNDIYITK